MAASSTATAITVTATHNYKHDARCSFLLHQIKSHRFFSTTTSPSNKVHNLNRVVIRRATPEVAGDLLSFFSLPPGSEGNPWLAGVGGLVLGLPLIIQKLVALLMQLDEAAKAVHNIAKEVGDAEGKLKQVVDHVEKLGNDTSNGKYKISHDMDKMLLQQFDFSSMVAELQESHKKEIRAMSEETVRAKHAREKAEAMLAEVMAEMDALKVHCNTYRITADRHRADLIHVHQKGQEVIGTLQLQIEDLKKELHYVRAHNNNSIQQDFVQ